MTRHSRHHLRDKEQLFLHEELMLLALRDEEGTVISSSIVYMLAGALVATLLLEGRAAFTDDKKKHIEIVNDEPFDDPVLDECVERIKKEKKPKSLKEWVLKFVHLKKLKERVLRSLVDLRIVHADEATVLLFFKQKIHPQVDPGPERRIVERMRHAIFRGTRDVEARTVALISLAKAAGLLHHHFDKSDLRERKDRIKEIVSGDATGRAAKQAAEAAHAAQAATMVAIMAATSAASSASSH